MAKRQFARHYSILVGLGVVGVLLTAISIINGLVIHYDNLVFNIIAFYGGWASIACCGLAAWLYAMRIGRWRQRQSN